MTKEFSNPLAAKQQCNVVLKHLKDHGSITAFDAINEYSITRLAARIHDLRKKGHLIATGRMTNPVGHDYARYTLLQEAVNG